MEQLLTAELKEYIKMIEKLNEKEYSDDEFENERIEIRINELLDYYTPILINFIINLKNLYKKSSDEKYKMSLKNIVQHFFLNVNQYIAESFIDAVYELNDKELIDFLEL